MEDMLIAHVKTYMQICWTRGQQLFYHDHIVNFRQDITDIARHLPRLPDSVDVVIIRKDDVDLMRHVDFVVHQEKVKAALKYRIAHDQNYSDLVVDDEVLSCIHLLVSPVHFVVPYLTCLKIVMLLFMNTWPMLFDATLLGEGSCLTCVDP